MDKLLRAGAILTNQCPLIRGSTTDTLRAAAAAVVCGDCAVLSVSMSSALGNRAYTVPIEEGYAIYEAARQVSGWPNGCGS